MNYETIITEECNNVFIITFNRLKSCNAMDCHMTQEVSDALDYWDKNDSLRVCILTHNGPVFCAGSDLKEIAAGEWKLPEGRENWGFAAMTKRTFDKPIIAAIRGKALGGGTEIVSACDLAVASDESVFGLPETRVGLTAAGGGTLLRLAQQIPMKFAMELALTSEPISAQKANDWGLINYVVPDDQVLDKALYLAEKIALGAPLSTKYSKKTILETMGENIVFPSKGWDIVDACERITKHSEDAHEGSMAFVEKRTPRWTGK